MISNQKVSYLVQGDRFQDARNLILGNIDYILDTTIAWLEQTYPNLTDGTKPDYDATTCARDLRLIIIAWCNDLRYGGNQFSVDAAESYIVGGAIDYIVGETVETIAAIQYARDLAIQAIQNLLPFSDITITQDPGGCADVQSAITVLAQIVWDAIDNPGNVPTSNVGNYPYIREGITLGGLPVGEYYVTRVDDNNFKLSTTFGGSDHTFVSALPITGSNGFTGTPSAATYDPKTGDLVFTVSSNTMTTSHTITLQAGAFTFTCAGDNHATTHAYPRTTDPAYNTPLAITNVNGNDVTINVGIADTTVDISSLSTDSQHQLTVEFDDFNTNFQLRTRGTATVPTNKNQLMVTINGIVQNPSSYTLSGSTITFLEAPMRDSTVIIMYFKLSLIHI
mgnify:FL=1